MVEKQKKKITFLFGAGCEGRGQYDLPSGKDFKKSTIKAENVKDWFSWLNPKKYLPDNKMLLHHNSSSIFYQTLVESKWSYEKNAGEKSNDGFYFLEEDARKIQDYLNLKRGETSAENKSKEEKEAINKRFGELFKKYCYDPIKELPKEDRKMYERNSSYFLENAKFFSFIDSLFNCLRMPEDYESEVKRVMRAYFAAFRSIVVAMYANKKDDDWAEYSKVINDLISNPVEANSDEDFCENRKMLMEFILELESRLAKDENRNTSYYNFIKQQMESHASEADFSFITTNYTSIAEKVLGISDKKIAYVHGRLHMFENLETKEVSQLSDFSPTDTIFPFIFIQSGIKPIVSTYQIEQFYRAISFCQEADCFVVLGYGINSDDEHITNIVRERIKKNKKTIIFLHGEANKPNCEGKKQNVKEENVIDELRLSKLPDGCTIEWTADFQDVLSKILTKES